MDAALWPAWLNEGIATVTVDRFAGQRTIRRDTLDLMRDHQPKSPPPMYRELSRIGGADFVYHAVRGYWLTGLIEDRRPGFLKRKFSQEWRTDAIEPEIAIELGVGPESFWHDIDTTIVDHFETTAA